MKNNGMISPASLALASMTMAQAGAGFLGSREQVISLLPMKPSPHAGYIWRRIFLKKGKPALARRTQRER